MTTHVGSILRALAALLVVAAGCAGGAVAGWTSGMLLFGSESMARALAIPGGAFGAMYAAWAWRAAGVRK